ncbi:MAG: hypothetical protein IT381_01940 [Deltaproteobacteria bacterium]|nr:hypothetical protein [Deltaproteobacteria bacterium]
MTTDTLLRMVERADGQTPRVRPQPGADPTIVNTPVQQGPVAQPPAPQTPTRHVDVNEVPLPPAQGTAQPVNAQAPQVETRDVDGGVSAQGPNIVPARSQAAAWHEPSVEDHQAVETLLRLARERTLSPAQTRALAETIATAAQRPGGVAYLIVLYERANEQREASTGPATARRPAQAPLSLDALVTRMPPSALRRHAEQTLREARPQVTARLLPPAPTAPGAPPTPLRAYAATQPRLAYALNALYPTEGQDLAALRRAAGADTRDLARWAENPATRRSLEALNIGEADISAFISANGDVRLMRGPPANPILAVMHMAEQGNARALGAFNSVLSLQLIVGRARLSETQARIDVIADALRTGHEPGSVRPLDAARRSELAAEMSTLVETRRQLRVVHTQTSVLRSATSTHYRDARDASLIREAAQLQRTIEHPPTQVDRDRLNELEPRARALRQARPPTAESREYLALHARVTAYDRAVRRADDIRTRTRERAVARESALSRYMREHHLTRIEDVPPRIRNWAQDMNDAVVGASTASWRARTEEGLEADEAHDETEREFGPAGDPEVHAGATFDRIGDAGVREFAARSEQLNQVNLQTPPPRPTVPTSPRDVARMRERDRRDEDHQRAMRGVQQTRERATERTLHSRNIDPEAVRQSDASRATARTAQTANAEPASRPEATQPVTAITGQQATAQLERERYARVQIGQNAPIPETVALETLSTRDRALISSCVQTTGARIVVNDRLTAALDSQQRVDLRSRDPRQIEAANFRAAEIQTIDRETAGLNRRMGGFVSSGLRAMESLGAQQDTAARQLRRVQEEREAMARGLREEILVTPRNAEHVRAELRRRGITARLEDVQDPQVLYDIVNDMHTAWRRWDQAGHPGVSQGGMPPVVIDTYHLERSAGRLANLRTAEANARANFSTANQQVENGPATTAMDAARTRAPAPNEPAQAGDPPEVTALRGYRDAADRSVQHGEEALRQAQEAATSQRLSPAARRQLGPTARQTERTRADYQSWHGSFAATMIPIEAQIARTRVRSAQPAPELVVDGYRSTLPRYSAPPAEGPRPTGTPEQQRQRALEAATASDAARARELDAEQNAARPRADEAIAAQNAATETTIRAVRAVTAPNAANVGPTERQATSDLLAQVHHARVRTSRDVARYNPEAALPMLGQSYLAAGGQLRNAGRPVTIGQPPVPVPPLAAEAQLTATNPLYSGPNAVPLVQGGVDIAQTIRVEARQAMPNVYVAIQSRRQTNASGTPPADLRTAGDARNMMNALALVPDSVGARGADAVAAEQPSADALARFSVEVDRSELDMMAVLNNRAVAVRNQMALVRAAFDELRASGRQTADQATFVLITQLQALVDFPSDAQISMSSTLDTLQARVDALGSTWARQNEALATQIRNADLSERANIMAALGQWYSPRNPGAGAEQVLQQARGILPPVVVRTPQINDIQPHDLNDPFLQRTFASLPYQVTSDRNGNVTGLRLAVSRESVTASDFRGSRVVGDAQIAGQTHIRHVAENIPWWLTATNMAVEFIEIELLTLGMGGLEALGARALGRAMRGVEFEAEMAAAAMRLAEMEARLGSASARLLSLSDQLGALGFQVAGRAGRFVLGGAGSLFEMYAVSLVQEGVEAWAARNLPPSARVLVHLGMQAGFNRVQGEASNTMHRRELIARWGHGLFWATVPVAVQPFVIRAMLPANATPQQREEAERNASFVLQMVLPALHGSASREIQTRRAERSAHAAEVSGVVTPLPEHATPAQIAEHRAQLALVEPMLQPLARASVETPGPAAFRRAADHIEQSVTADQARTTANPPQRPVLSAEQHARLGERVRQLREQARDAELSTAALIATPRPSDRGATNDPAAWRQYRADVRHSIEANLPRDLPANERQGVIDRATQRALDEAVLQGLPAFSSHTIADAAAREREIDTRVADLRARFEHAGLDPVRAEAQAIALLQGSLSQRIHDLEGATPRQRDRRASELVRLHAAMGHLEAAYHAIAPRVRVLDVSEGASAVPIERRPDLRRDLDTFVREHGQDPPAEFWRGYREVVAHYAPDAAEAITTRAAFNEASEVAARTPRRRGEDARAAANINALRLMQAAGFDPARVVQILEPAPSNHPAADTRTGNAADGRQPTTENRAAADRAVRLETSNALETSLNSPQNRDVRTVREPGGVEFTVVRDASGRVTGLSRRGRSGDVTISVANFHAGASSHRFELGRGDGGVIARALVPGYEALPHNVQAETAAHLNALNDPHATPERVREAVMALRALGEQNTDAFGANARARQDFALSIDAAIERHASARANAELPAAPRTAEGMRAYGDRYRAALEAAGYRGADGPGRALIERRTQAAIADLARQELPALATPIAADAVAARANQLAERLQSHLGWPIGDAVATARQLVRQELVGQVVPQAIFGLLPPAHDAILGAANGARFRARNGVVYEVRTENGQRQLVPAGGLGTLNQGASPHPLSAATLSDLHLTPDRARTQEGALTAVPRDAGPVIIAEGGQILRVDPTSIDGHRDAATGALPASGEAIVRVREGNTWVERRVRFSDVGDLQPAAATRRRARSYGPEGRVDREVAATIRFGDRQTIVTRAGDGRGRVDESGQFHLEIHGESAVQVDPAMARAYDRARAALEPADRQRLDEVVGGRRVDDPSAPGGARIEGGADSAEAQLVMMRVFAARGGADGVADVHTFLAELQRVRPPVNTPERLLEVATADGLVQYFGDSCMLTSAQYMRARSNPLEALRMVVAGPEPLLREQLRGLRQHGERVRERNPNARGWNGQMNRPAAMEVGNPHNTNGAAHPMYGAGGRPLSAFEPGVAQTSAAGMDQVAVAQQMNQDGPHGLRAQLHDPALEYVWVRQDGPWERQTDAGRAQIENTFYAHLANGVPREGVMVRVNTPAGGHAMVVTAVENRSPPGAPRDPAQTFYTVRDPASGDSFTVSGRDWTHGTETMIHGLDAFIMGVHHTGTVDAPTLARAYTEVQGHGPGMQIVIETQTGHREPRVVVDRRTVDGVDSYLVHNPLNHTITLVPATELAGRIRGLDRRAHAGAAEMHARDTWVPDTEGPWVVTGAAGRNQWAYAAREAEGALAPATTTFLNERFADAGVRRERIEQLVRLLGSAEAATAFLNRYASAAGGGSDASARWQAGQTLARLLEVATGTSGMPTDMPAERARSVLALLASRSNDAHFVWQVEAALDGPPWLREIRLHGLEAIARGETLPAAAAVHAGVRAVLDRHADIMAGRTGAPDAQAMRQRGAALEADLRTLSPADRQQAELAIARAFHDERQSTERTTRLRAEHGPIAADVASHVAAEIPTVDRARVQRAIEHALEAHDTVTAQSDQVSEPRRATLRGRLVNELTERAGLTREQATRVATETLVRLETQRTLGLHGRTPPERAPLTGVPEPIAHALRAVDQLFTNGPEMQAALGRLGRDVDGELATIARERHGELPPNARRLAMLRVIVREFERLGLLGPDAPRPETMRSVLSNEQFATMLREHGLFFDWAFPTDPHGADTHIVQMLLMARHFEANRTLGQRPDGPQNVRGLLDAIGRLPAAQRTAAWDPIFDAGPGSPSARQPETLGAAIHAAILDGEAVALNGERRLARGMQNRAEMAQRMPEISGVLSAEHVDGNAAHVLERALTGQQIGSPDRPTQGRMIAVQNAVESGSVARYRRAATELLTHPPFSLSAEHAQRIIDRIAPEPPRERPLHEEIGAPASAQRDLARDVDSAWLALQRSAGTEADVTAYLRAYRTAVERHATNPAGVEAAVARETQRLRASDLPDPSSDRTGGAQAHSPPAPAPQHWEAINRIPNFASAVATLPAPLQARLRAAVEGVLERMPAGAAREEALLRISSTLFAHVAEGPNAPFTAERFVGVLERFQRLGTGDPEALALLVRIGQHTAIPDGASPAIRQRIEEHNRYGDALLAAATSAQPAGPANAAAIVEVLRHVRAVQNALAQGVLAGRRSPLSPELVQQVVGALARMPAVEAQRLAGSMLMGDNPRTVMALLHAYSEALTDPTQATRAIDAVAALTFTGARDPVLARRVQLELARELVPALRPDATDTPQALVPPTREALALAYSRAVARVMSETRQALAAREAAVRAREQTERPPLQREWEALAVIEPDLRTLGQRARFAELQRQIAAIDAERQIVDALGPQLRALESELGTAASNVARSRSIATFAADPARQELATEVSTLASRDPALFDAIAPGLEHVPTSLLRVGDIAAVHSIVAALSPQDAARVRNWLGSINDPATRVVALRMLGDAWVRHIVGADGPRPAVSTLIDGLNARLASPDSVARERAAIEAAPAQLERGGTHPPTVGADFLPRGAQATTPGAGYDHIAQRAREWAVTHYGEIRAFFRDHPGGLEAFSGLHTHIMESLRREDAVRARREGREPISDARLHLLAETATNAAIVVAGAHQIELTPGVTALVPNDHFTAETEAYLAPLRAMIAAAERHGVSFRDRPQVIMLAPADVGNAGQVFAGYGHNADGFANEERQISGSTRRFAFAVMHNTADTLGGRTPVHEFVHVLMREGAIRVPAELSPNSREMPLSEYLQEHYLRTREADVSPTRYGRDQADEFAAEIIAEYMYDPRGVRARLSRDPRDRALLQTIERFFGEPPALPEPIASAMRQSREGAGGGVDGAAGPRNDGQDSVLLSVARNGPAPLTAESIATNELQSIGLAGDRGVGVGTQILELRNRQAALTPRQYLDALTEILERARVAPQSARTYLMAEALRTANDQVRTSRGALQGEALRDALAVALRERGLDGSLADVLAADSARVPRAQSGTPPAGPAMAPRAEVPADTQAAAARVLRHGPIGELLFQRFVRQRDVIAANAARADATQRQRDAAARAPADLIARLERAATILDALPAAERARLALVPELALTLVADLEASSRQNATQSNQRDARMARVLLSRVAALPEPILRQLATYPLVATRLGQSFARMQLGEAMGGRAEAPLHAAFGRYLEVVATLMQHTARLPEQQRAALVEALSHVDSIAGIDRFIAEVGSGGAASLLARLQSPHAEVRDRALLEIRMRANLASGDPDVVLVATLGLRLLESDRVRVQNYEDEHRDGDRVTSEIDLETNLALIEVTTGADKTNQILQHYIPRAVGPPLRPIILLAPAMRAIPERLQRELDARRDRGEPVPRVLIANSMEQVLRLLELERPGSAAGRQTALPAFGGEDANRAAVPPALLTALNDRAAIDQDHYRQVQAGAPAEGAARTEADQPTRGPGVPRGQPFPNPGTQASAEARMRVPTDGASYTQGIRRTLQRLIAADAARGQAVFVPMVEQLLRTSFGSTDAAAIARTRARALAALGRAETVEQAEAILQHWLRRERTVDPPAVPVERGSAMVLAVQMSDPSGPLPSLQGTQRAGVIAALGQLAPSTEANVHVTRNGVFVEARTPSADGNTVESHFRRIAADGTVEGEYRQVHQLRPPRVIAFGEGTTAPRDPFEALPAAAGASDQTTAAIERARLAILHASGADARALGTNSAESGAVLSVALRGLEGEIARLQAMQQTPALAAIIARARAAYDLAATRALAAASPEIRALVETVPVAERARVIARVLDPSVAPLFAPGRTDWQRQHALAFVRAMSPEAYRRVVGGEAGEGPPRRLVDFVDRLPEVMSWLAQQAAANPAAVATILRADPSLDGAILQSGALSRPNENTLAVPFASMARDFGVRETAALVHLSRAQPMGLRLLLREQGPDAVVAALRGNPAAVQAQAAAAQRRYVSAIDPGGAQRVQTLNPNEANALLAGIPRPRTGIDADQLRAMGLEPRLRLNIEGANVSVSEPFPFSDGRIGVVLYTVDSSGVVQPRLACRSNSQGVWRVSDATAGNGHIGKGMHESDTPLPIAFTAIAFRMSDPTVSRVPAGQPLMPLRDPTNGAIDRRPPADPNDPSAQARLSDLAFTGLVQDGGGFINVRTEVDPQTQRSRVVPFAVTRDSNGQWRTNDAHGAAALNQNGALLASSVPGGVHYYTPRYRAEHNADPTPFSIVNGPPTLASRRQIPWHDPRTIALPGSAQHPDARTNPRLPDFGRVVDTFSYDVPSYGPLNAGHAGPGETAGRLTARVFLSRDGQTRYVFVEDSQGRAALVSAQPAQGEISSFGNHREYLDLRGMDAGLMEYEQMAPIGQAPPDARGQPQGRYGGQTVVPNGGVYVNNWNYVRQLPIVRHYYESQGRTPPPPIVLAAAPPPPPPAAQRRPPP